MGLGLCKDEFLEPNTHIQLSKNSDRITTNPFELWQKREYNLEQLLCGCIG